MSDRIPADVRTQLDGLKSGVEVVLGGKGESDDAELDVDAASRYVEFVTA